MPIDIDCIEVSELQSKADVFNRDISSLNNKAKSISMIRFSKMVYSVWSLARTRNPITERCRWWFISEGNVSVDALTNLEASKSACENFVTFRTKRENWLRHGFVQCYLDGCIQPKIKSRFFFLVGLKTLHYSPIQSILYSVINASIYHVFQKSVGMDFHFCWWVQCWN